MTHQPNEPLRIQRLADEPALLALIRDPGEESERRKHDPGLDLVLIDLHMPSAGSSPGAGGSPAELPESVWI